MFSIDGDGHIAVDFDGDQFERIDRFITDEILKAGNDTNAAMEIMLMLCGLVAGNLMGMTDESKGADAFRTISRAGLGFALKNYHWFERSQFHAEDRAG